MGSTVLRWADSRIEPWTNGSGATHPLAQGAGDSWRVSIAEIDANAEFSRLPNVHRQFVCLGPVPLRLYIDERPEDVPVGVVTTFSGGSHVRCEVGRPVLALNVMSRTGTPAPDVQLLDLRAGVRRVIPQMKRGLFVVLAGTAQITTPEVTGTLTPYDAVDCHDAVVQLEGVGRGALIVL